MLVVEHVSGKCKEAAVCCPCTREATQRPRWASTRVEGTRDRGAAPLHALAPVRGSGARGWGCGWGRGQGRAHGEGMRGVWGWVYRRGRALGVGWGGGRGGEARDALRRVALQPVVRRERERSPRQHQKRGGVAHVSTRDAPRPAVDSHHRARASRRVVLQMAC